MRTAQFAVIEADGAWRIHLNGEPVARFERQIDAIACAADLAATSQRDGREVEVLVQDGEGHVAVLDGSGSLRSKSAGG